MAKAGQILFVIGCCEIIKTLSFNKSFESFLEVQEKCPVTVRKPKSKYKPSDRNTHHELLRFK